MRRIESWLSPNRKAIAVFLGAALFSLPGAVRLVHRAIELAPLPYEQRRERELGEFYPSLRTHERTLPPGDVNVLLVGENAIDRGIFINYYLYPRASHLFFGEMPADTPRRPLLVTEATGAVRKTIVREPRATSAAQREMLVPIVTALQGSDGYATEAVFVSDREARVSLTLMPSGATKTFDLRARLPLVFNDLVFESFGVTATGWLRVQATSPVRAGFWFVNRGKAVAAPVPLATPSPGMHRVAGGEKLWVLNPSAGAITARVNGANETIEANALRVFGAQAMNEVESTQPLVAFTTAKQTNGNTSFTW